MTFGARMLFTPVISFPLPSIAKSCALHSYTPGIVKLNREYHRSGNIRKWPIDTLIRSTCVAKPSAIVQANWVVLCRSQILQVDALFLRTVRPHSILCDFMTYEFPAKLREQFCHLPSRPISVRLRCRSILSGRCLPYLSMRSWGQRPYRKSCRQAGSWSGCS